MSIQLDGENLVKRLARITYQSNISCCEMAERLIGEFKGEVVGNKYRARQQAKREEHDRLEEGLLMKGVSRKQSKNAEMLKESGQMENLQEKHLFFKVGDNVEMKLAR